MRTMEHLYNSFAEQSVIGGMLVADWTDRAMSALEMLIPDDFYMRQTRFIWQAITEMHSKQMPIDLLTLSDYMETNGYEFERVYLAEIANDTPSQANLRQYAKIVKDMARLRKALALSLDACNALQDPGDPDERINKALSFVSCIGQDDNEETEIKTAGEVLDSLLAQIQEAHASGGKVLGVSTGFENLDSMCSGFKPGELIILAARPSMGKTTLAMNIGENIAYLGADDKKVLKFSLEMPAQMLMKKTVSRFGSLYTAKMDNGSCLNDDLDTARLDHGIQPVLKRRDNLMIDDKGGLHISQIQARAKRAYMRMGGLDLVIVDYLGLIQAEGESQTIRVGNVSAGLKNLAKNLNVPVLCLCQLNRNITTKPELKNLRDSGNIEQDADVVIFLHDEDYEGNRGSHSLTEVIFAKQRMGATGSTFLQPDLAFSRFVDTNRLPEVKKQDEPKKFRRFEE